MSKGWKHCQLGDVIELKRGYDLPQKERQPGTVPLVSSSGVSDTHSVAKVKRPGVVTGRYGTIGTVYYVEDDFWPLNTTLYVRDFKGNDPRFVSYFLRGIDFHAYSDKAAVPGLNRNDLHQANVLFPPLPEQRAIAATLGALDDKIELNRKMNATLEAMARALFRDWFVDFGPTRAKMEGAAPYLSPDLWALFPDRLNDEGKPEGWGVRSVYDVARVIYGAPFASKRFNTERTGAPLIRIRDLATHEPGVWTEEVHPKGHLIEPGDIVVGMDGEFRLHIWKGATAWLNQRVCHFEPLPGVPSAFLAEALIDPLAFFERGKVGTTVIHLGKSDIDTFQLLHPGKELLSAFGEMTGTLIDATVKNATQSRTLAQTRDLLLPRLMSGELRVAEAAQAVEAAQ